MNSLSIALEKLVADPRVRIAGPGLAAVMVIGFLVMGTVAQTPVRATKTVSVLPDQPLDIPMLGRSQAVSGVDAILAWKQPAAKPAPVKAQAAGKQVKKVPGTLTARR
jgi:hypothetical protein